MPKAKVQRVVGKRCRGRNRDGLTQISMCPPLCRLQLFLSSFHAHRVWWSCRLPNSNKVILPVKACRRQSQLGILSDSICPLFARAKGFKLELEEIEIGQ